MGKHTAARFGLALCLLALTAGGSVAGTWKDEFDRICGQTEDAGSLSAERLRLLLKDSDALLNRLEAVSDPAKKVYVLRLQKCKSFFAYMLALKDAPGPADGGRDTAK